MTRTTQRALVLGVATAVILFVVPTAGYMTFAGNSAFVAGALFAGAAGFVALVTGSVLRKLRLRGWERRWLPAEWWLIFVGAVFVILFLTLCISGRNFDTFILALAFFGTVAFLSGAIVTMLAL